MNWFKRFWSCRVRGAHQYGRAIDYTPGMTDQKGYVWPAGRYKECRLCGTVRAVRRRKGKA